MKILYISYHYAPYNCIAAVRATKMTKYLCRLGHDIRVLSAKDQLLPRDLQVEVDLEKIIYANWIDINKPFQLFGGGRDISKIAANRSYLTSKQKKSSLIKFLGRLYKTIFHFPDDKIGWIPNSIKEINLLFEEWKPDVTYVSSGPFSSFVLAKMIHKKYGIPWVAEYRDLWVDSHNYKYGSFRKYLESIAEKWSTSTASEYITVSDPLAELLRERSNKKVHVITNGYDEEDLTHIRNGNIEYGINKLNLVYTGQIYVNKQKLNKLFDVIANSESLKEKVRIHFYGPNLQYKITHNYDSDLLDSIKSNIKYHGLVDRNTALRAQKQADILLFLGWSDKGHRGILTGKLFEYMSAKRVILSINDYVDDASSIIEDKGIGCICLEEKEIEEKLIQYVEIKEKFGSIELQSTSKIDTFSYKNIATKVANILASLVK